VGVFFFDLVPAFFSFLFLLIEWIGDLLASIERANEDEEGAASDDEA